MEKEESRWKYLISDIRATMYHEILRRTYN